MLQGLTEHEADQRLAQHGYNEIPEEKAHPLLKFLSYFWGPIPWMIEAALVLSALAQRLPDFLIILVLLLVNSVVGFWQEHKAENAIEILKQRLSPVARVLRDGQWKKIPARELVPDDVVKIRIGDIVPADVEIVEGEGTIDESALTGESLPVSKKAGELLYASSVVRQGEFVGVVRATGVNTYFGKTATLVERAKGQSHLQRFILKVGDFLIILAVALVLVVLLVGFERHEDMGELLRFALVLMVSAIPAALPAVLSVTMAVGAIALAKKQAIARRLVAIEEMAGMDVLCSDKTGTLTLNQLKPATPITIASDEREVILYAALASRVEDDPIDAAILGEAKRLGISTEGYHVVEFTPWDPVSKRTQALVEKDGARLQVSKGAPQVLAQMAGEDVSAQVDALAERGYRTIAVAVDTGDGWRLAGLIPLHDPPRPDSAKVLDEARQLGVEVKMLTGDHIAIAKEVASLLHLGSRIVNASEVAEKPYPEAARTIEQANGFAEVFPEHKYTIVDALQKHGHIVGMTGDGVNDAPALKKAEVGIAVAGATDAAKSAADIVLTGSGLSVVIDAIKESRRIFQRMQSYTIYRIAETVRLLFFITLAILVFNFYPVTTVMIILLALLNDVPILAIAYDRATCSSEPDRWHTDIVLTVATVLGVLGVASSFGLFFIAERFMHLDLETIRTFMFLKLAVAGHLTIFLTRTRGYFWSVKPSAALFWAAVSTKLLATLVAVYGLLMAPIGWWLAILIWVYALAWFVLNDWVKVELYKLFESRLGRRLTRSAQVA